MTDKLNKDMLNRHLFMKLGFENSVTLFQNGRCPDTVKIWMEYDDSEEDEPVGWWVKITFSGIRVAEHFYEDYLTAIAMAGVEVLRFQDQDFEVVQGEK